MEGFTSLIFCAPEFRQNFCLICLKKYEWASKSLNLLQTFKNYAMTNKFHKHVLWSYNSDWKSNYLSEDKIFRNPPHFLLSLYGNLQNQVKQLKWTSPP